MDEVKLGQSTVSEAERDVFDRLSRSTVASCPQELG